MNLHQPLILLDPANFPRRSWEPERPAMPRSHKHAIVKRLNQILLVALFYNSASLLASDPLDRWNARTAGVADNLLV